MNPALAGTSKYRLIRVNSGKLQPLECIRLAFFRLYPNNGVKTLPQHFARALLIRSM